MFTQNGSNRVGLPNVNLTLSMTFYLPVICRISPVFSSLRWRKVNERMEYNLLTHKYTTQLVSV